jgi:hypothetical protein
MAIENNDLVVLQQNSSGSLRKATVAALLNNATTPNLQAVTTAGNTTNDSITASAFTSTTDINADGDIKAEGDLTAGSGDSQVLLNGTTGEIGGGADVFIDCGIYF